MGICTVIPGDKKRSCTITIPGNEKAGDHHHYHHRDLIQRFDLTRV